MFEKGKMRYDMGEYLPGNLQERLIELRKTHGYKSQQQLVDALGGIVDKTTYSRIESGATKTINNELLVKLAELYNVSADYILGIANVPEKTYFDIQELGLSVEAAKNLYSGKVSTKVINELLINEKFATATKMMDLFFSNSLVRMLQTQNTLLDFSCDIVSECNEAGHIPADSFVKNLKKKLKVARIPAVQTELMKIENQLMASVKDIKRKVENELAEVTTATEKLNYEILETVKNEVAAKGDMEKYSYEEQVEIITEAVIAGIALDESIPEERFKELEVSVRQMMPVLLNLWQK